LIGWEVERIIFYSLEFSVMKDFEYSFEKLDVWKNPEFLL